MPRPAPRSPSKTPGAPEARRPGARAATGAASANGTKHNKERYRQAATGQYRRGESRKYISGKIKKVNSKELGAPGGRGAAPTRKLRDTSTRLLPLAIAIEPVLEANRSVELLNARSSGTLL